MALQYQGMTENGASRIPSPRPVMLYMVARYAAMSYGFSGTSRFCIAISLLLGKAVIRYNYIGWGEGGGQYQVQYTRGCALSFQKPPVVIMNEMITLLV